MPDKKVRTLEEIKTEYTQVCVKAGHLQYTIITTQKELSAVNDLLLDLNLEGAAAQKREETDKIVESEKSNA